MAKTCVATVPAHCCAARLPAAASLPEVYPQQNASRALFAEMRNRLCFIGENGAPGGIRTPDLLVRRKAVKNSKCCFWCRLQRNAPFISLLNWTEVGLK